MGLKTRIVSGHHFVDIGAFIIGRGWGGMQPAGFNGDWDPVVQALTNTVMPFGSFLVEDAAGHLCAGSDETLDLLRTKPEAMAYHADWDYARHGGIIPSITALGRLLNGVPPSGSVPSSEKEVSHPSIRGDVELMRDVSDWQLFSGETSMEILTSASRPIQGNGFVAYAPRISHSVGCTHVNGSVWAYNGHDLVTGTNLPRRTTTFTVAQMLNGNYCGVGRVDYRVHNSKFAHETRITALNWTATPSSATLDYSLRNTSWGSGTYHFGQADWHGRFSITLLKKREPEVWPPLEESSAYLGSAFTFNERWEFWCDSVTYPSAGRIWWGDAGVPGYHHDVNSGGPRFTECVVLSDPVACRGTIVVGDPIPRITKRLNPTIMSNEVARRLGDIRYSSFQSTYAAFEDMNQGLNTNLVETLAQVGGYLDYFPHLKEALDAVSSMTRKDLPGTLKGLMDLTTELRLRDKFSYSPDLDFVIETLPKVEEVYNRLFGASKEVVVGRGIFNWDFPAGEFYRPSASLKTCTKLVGLRDNDSVVSHVLGLDNLGVLPTPSRLWDLIPFSFVVDWFIKVGDRIRDLEGLGFLTSTPPSYLVHSYLVRSPLSDEDLSEAGLIPLNHGATPEWRFYVREVSTSLPVPSEGRYDFRFPANPPSWVTAGSLLWQLAI